MSQITFKSNTVTRMTTSKQYDFLSRLTSISSAVGASAIGNSYACNNANQRVRSTLADGSYWLYDYDSLGQVRSGRRYWSDQTPVAGQQFEYAHDDIGNRMQTKAGGDQNGANLRTANYGANSLNQYTNRDMPTAFDVMGLSFATNAVTVNGQAAYRKGEYFRAELPVSNGSTSVWQSVSVAATNQTTVSGNAYVPKNQEQFYYDLDGNLTNDGRWTYSWDAENRLVKLAPNTSIGPRNSIKFEYDWQGRRLHKQVWANTGWSGSPTNDVKFVYDDWNLLAELNATNNVVIRSFMWGLDLSGSLQGAGGVGGLLEVVYKGTQTTNCFVAFDGNGNVAALTDAGGTSILAQYEYGPFGEVLRKNGDLAYSNPFRLSTKYQDEETDLLYYGYRYYDPISARWKSRDMSGEHHSLNLYAFVGNAAITQIDPQGLNIYVTAGNGGATKIDDLHVNIFVDKWDVNVPYEFENGTIKWHKSGWVGFSFGKLPGLRGVRMVGPKSTWLGWASYTFTCLKGVIYVVDVDFLDTEVLRERETTFEQDNAWLHYMLSPERTGQEDGYSLLHHNCRKYVNMEFDDAPNHF